MATAHTYKIPKVKILLYPSSLHRQHTTNKMYILIHKTLNLVNFKLFLKQTLLPISS